MPHTPTPRRAPATIGVLVAALGLLASCGAGQASLGAADQAYADAMVDSMNIDPENPFAEAESRCLAEGTVAIIGADTLDGWGLSPESIAEDPTIEFPSMSEDMATRISELYFDGECFDFGAMLGRAMSAGAATPIDAEKTSCLADRLSGSQAFRKAFVASMMGDVSVDPFAEVGDIVTLLGDCGIDMADLGS